MRRKSRGDKRWAYPAILGAMAVMLGIFGLPGNPQGRWRENCGVVADIAAPEQ